MEEEEDAWSRMSVNVTMLPSLGVKSRLPLLPIQLKNQPKMLKDIVHLIDTKAANSDSWKDVAIKPALSGKVKPYGPVYELSTIDDALELFAPFQAKSKGSPTCVLVLYEAKVVAGAGGAGRDGNKGKGGGVQSDKEAKIIEWISKLR
ncbi:hypothetical protein HDU98_008317 [Podochytrium sp. JEL0797]|nr:hypothetical protein HDU98_008317 [Podochytrium sp. JEL0797]